jgi:hypothetical protein
LRERVSCSVIIVISGHNRSDRSWKHVSIIKQIHASTREAGKQKKIFQTVSFAVDFEWNDFRAFKWTWNVRVFFWKLRDLYQLLVPFPFFFSHIYTLFLIWKIFRERIKISQKLILVKRDRNSLIVDNETIRNCSSESY